jgi:hypothetical protein
VQKLTKNPTKQMKNKVASKVDKGTVTGDKVTNQAEVVKKKSFFKTLGDL